MRLRPAPADLPREGRRRRAAHQALPRSSASPSTPPRGAAWCCRAPTGSPSSPTPASARCSTTPTRSTICARTWKTNALELSKMPLVIQFNKRDLPEIRSEGWSAEAAARGDEPVLPGGRHPGHGRGRDASMGLLHLTWGCWTDCNSTSSRRSSPSTAKMLLLQRRAAAWRAQRPSATSWPAGWRRPAQAHSGRPRSKESSAESHAALEIAGVDCRPLRLEEPGRQAQRCASSASRAHLRRRHPRRLPGLALLLGPAAPGPITPSSASAARASPPTLDRRRGRRRGRL